MNLNILIIFVFCVSVQTCLSNGEEIQEKTQGASTIQESSIKRSSHQYKAPNYQGFWKKKFIWKPRWVKTWQEKKIYVAVWKRMWGPAEVKEWIPVPKPPPGWVDRSSKNDVRNYFFKVPH